MQNISVYFLRLVIIATVIPWFDLESLEELPNQDCLDFDITSIVANKTNAKRRMHSAGPLSINEDLILEATEIAWQFAFRGNIYQYDRRGETVHIVPINDTEELSKENTDFNAVEYWYSQRYSYPGSYHAASRFSYEYFTQIVWMSTKEIGCGACHNTVAIFIVCKFEPQGNIRGAFRDNVEMGNLSGSKYTYELVLSLKIVLLLILLVLKF